MLHGAVEVLDDAHVVAVRVNLGVPGRVHDPDAAVRLSGDTTIRVRAVRRTPSSPVVTVGTVGVTVVAVVTVRITVVPEPVPVVTESDADRETRDLPVPVAVPVPVTVRGTIVVSGPTAPRNAARSRYGVADAWRATPRLPTAPRLRTAATPPARRLTAAPSGAAASPLPSKSRSGRQREGPSEGRCRYQLGICHGSFSGCRSRNNPASGSRPFSVVFGHLSGSAPAGWSFSGDGSVHAPAFPVKTPPNQRFFPGPRPALQLVLALERLASRPAGLCIHQADRPPTGRVTGAAATVVRPLAFVGIAGIPGVQRSVGAPDDVDEMAPCFAAAHAVKRSSWTRALPALGSVIRNVLPPSAGASVSRPPFTSTAHFAIDSPSPVPRTSLVGTRRRDRTGRRCASCGSTTMPGPVSMTSTTAPAVDSETRTRIARRPACT